MNFLGQVNQFRGRLESGRVWVGNHSGNASQYEDDNQPDLSANAASSKLNPVTVFVRPHDFDISTQPRNERCSIPATVVRVRSAGNVVHVEMVTDAGEKLNAETSHQERSELKIEPGSHFYLIPRNLRIFTDEDSKEYQNQAASF